MAEFWKSFTDSLNKMFDFNKDGETNGGDVAYIFKSFFALILPIAVTAAKSGVKDLLMPALIAGIRLVIAKNIPGGREDKEIAALGAAVEHLKSGGIDLGIQAGAMAAGDTLAAIGDHFGLSTSEVDALFKNLVVQEKMDK